MTNWRHCRDPICEVNSLAPPPFTPEVEKETIRRQLSHLKWRKRTFADNCVDPWMRCNLSSLQWRQTFTTQHTRWHFPSASFVVRTNGYIDQYQLILIPTSKSKVRGTAGLETCCLPRYTHHVEDDVISCLNCDMETCSTCPVLRAKHVKTCTIHLCIVEDVEDSLSCTESKACKHMHHSRTCSGKRLG